MISIANEKQNITKQLKKHKNQKGILNVQPNKFVFREEKQTCSNENLCSAWLKPIKPVQIYGCPVVRGVRGGMVWVGGRGFLSICLIFQVIPPPLESATPWALDQSCEHQVSPHNLSLKAIIIIRSFRPSHGGKIWALLSLDKWNADSQSYKELQAITGGWGSAWGVCMKWCEWSIETTRIWVEIVSCARTGWYEDEKKAAKDRSRKERWWRAKKEGGAEEGKQRRIPVQDKTILAAFPFLPSLPLLEPFQKEHLSRPSLCPASRGNDSLLRKR